mgnify:CR=1 FL=1
MKLVVFYVQQPNYLGNIEDLVALGKVVHKVKAKIYCRR